MMITGDHNTYNDYLYTYNYIEIVHYDDIVKATLLNEYFTSVFTVDTDVDGCATLENGIGSIYWTPKYSLILIDKLNCSKAAGPDGIQSKIIKKC